MGEFQTTQWSLVRLAGQPHNEAAREALSALLETYLPALRAHLKYQRLLPEDKIDDLLQGFVSDKILQSDLIARADRTRGKFRTLLLTALSRYVVDQWRGASAQKRRGERVIDLEAEPQQGLARTELTAPHAFDVQWARQVLAEALRRMQVQCKESGRDDLWDIFQARLADPILNGTPPLAYDQLVMRFGLESPRQATNVLITAKRMFVRILREIVGEYTPAEEIDLEIRQLTEDLGAERREVRAS